MLSLIKGTAQLGLYQYDGQLKTNGRLMMHLIENDAQPLSFLGHKARLEICINQTLIVLSI